MFQPPDPGIEKTLTDEIRRKSKEHRAVLGALNAGRQNLRSLQEIVSSREELETILRWCRDNGLLKPGVDLNKREATYELTQLGILVVADLARAPH